MRKFSDRPNEQWAFIQKDGNANKKLAIFIHGFYGNYLSTWGKLPDMLMQNADGRQPFDEWDYVFLGYKTGNVETYLDIADLICTACKGAFAGAAPYNSPYSEVALFGHSLGTLGIRQLLCAWTIQPSNMISMIRSITLFGSPINGSSLATLASPFSGIASALKPANPQMRMLKSWNECAYTHHPWPAIRILLGLDDKIVGSKYASLIEWKGDATVDQSNLDHCSLVKPASWDNSLVIDYIQTSLK